MDKVLACYIARLGPAGLGEGRVSCTIATARAAAKHEIIVVERRSEPQAIPTLISALRQMEARINRVAELRT